MRKGRFGTLKNSARVVVKIIAVLFILGLFGVGIVLALLWREHKTEVILPEPTGPYAVGRTTDTWENRGTAMELSSLPAAAKFLLSDHSHEAQDVEHNQILANLQSIYDHLPNGGYFITIRGANHFSFSDQMLVKCPLLITVMHFAGLGRLDGRRGLAISAEYVHTFFDIYLKGKPRNVLTEVSTRYPEVSVEKH